jgi:hypothetical protein
VSKFKKILDTLCIWGIVTNLFVFSYALLEGLSGLQILSLVNISLLLVHFIVER